MSAGEGGVRSLAFLGDGRIAGGCGDGSIRISFLEGEPDVDNRSGEDAHVGALHALVLGPQLLDDADKELPRRLFTAGEDGNFKSWPLDSRRKPRTVELGSSPCTGVVWIPPPPRSKKEKRGGQLAVVTRNRRIVLINLTATGDLEDQREIIESDLERLAQDTHASGQPVREAAVRTLGGIAEDEARELLEKVLAGDKRPEVKALAAETIGTSRRRRSRPALRQALNDAAKAVRETAWKALQAVESDSPLAAVRAGLTSQHEDIRVQAVAALPALRHTSPLVPGLITDKLKDSSALVRQHALLGLIALDAPGSLEPLRIALGKGAQDVRIEALVRLALAHKTTDPLGRTLVEAALDDEDGAIRNLAFMVSVGANKRLADELSKKDPNVAKFLGELQKRGPLADPSVVGPITPQDVEPLFAAQACRHADTAVRGAGYLAMLGDARATGALLQLSRESDEEIRRAVVTALAGAAVSLPQDERIPARLEWLLDDQEEDVRSAAMDALLKLAGDDLARKLDLAETALRSAFEDIRVRALQILVGYGKGVPEELSKRADALLGDALNDEEEDVRGEAFRTLWTWHGKNPEQTLKRAAASRHPDIRLRVLDELERQKGSWVRPLMVDLVADASSDVGLAAYKVLTKADADKRHSDVHLKAMSSPRPDVRAAGAAGARFTDAAAVRSRLTELIREPQPEVHTAAIESMDKLLPQDEVAFAAAFASIFYALRVRAAELCGQRRDKRAVPPMTELLSIPKTHINRPTDDLRKRAARALADVGDPASVSFYVGMLDDEDGVVREMGARGLATACRAGEEGPLVAALAHADLSVRSWAAEGLARLGDTRALPVLAGTQRHEHRPIRIGAILGFVALGPDGIRGILQGLEDQDREIQDLVFAIIVARDVALARAGHGPDLLLSALSSSHPEIRFAAARTLEARVSGEPVEQYARELVGPRRPEKATDMKNWPAPEKQAALINVLVNSLASPDPGLRYAAARVLTLRPQPESFWREAALLQQPKADGRPWIPHTSWSDEAHQPRKRDWIRKLFGKRTAPAPVSSPTARVLTVVRYLGGLNPRTPPPAEGAVVAADIHTLVFGTYAGLIRQAPPSGDADETHRVRRDAIDRLATLAKESAVGRDAVMPALRHALSDPHHLVRMAAINALRSLYSAGSLEPLALAITSQASDVGRAAVDEIFAAALAGKSDARALALRTLEAPNAEVRAHALTCLPRLYDAQSLDPWLLALSSRHSDVRLSVVDRLADSMDSRVVDALRHALESDHDDLRLKAASVLANRGDARTVDVLGAFLKVEDKRIVSQAVETLIGYARMTKDASGKAAASRALAARLEDDPDKTADRSMLISAMGRVGHPAGQDTLLKLLNDDDQALRVQVLKALLDIATLKDKPRPRLPDGTTRERYDEPLALKVLSEAARNSADPVRMAVVRALRDVDDPEAERLLARLVEDRVVEIRVAACEALAFRAEHVPNATLAPLEATLRSARRELVLPAAAGLAAKRRPEAFQALMLVFKAGEGEERDRAVLGLGTLGDRRALEHLEPLVDPRAEIEDEDRVLAPAAAEALGRMLPRLEQEEERNRVRETVERLAREGSTSIRPRAFSGLRHAGDDRSRALLERIAVDKHDDATMRVYAIDELGKLAHAASEQVLADLLRDQDYRVRHTALAAINKIIPNDPTRVSLLALRSEHTDISEPAAAFLSRRGDARTLVARLGEIRDANVRRQLRQGLVRREAHPMDEIRTVLLGDAPGARADAAWMAGAARSKDLATAVRNAVERSATEWTNVVRMTTARASVKDQRPDEIEAAWAAGLWAARQVEAPVADQARQVLGDRQAPARVRREAARFLTRFGTASDVATLQAAAADSDSEVRMAAVQAVATLTPAKTAEMVQKVPVADAAAMAPAVATALTLDGSALMASTPLRQMVLPVAMGLKRVQALVQAALAPGKDPARLAAIAALGRMGGEEAKAALEKILANKSEEDLVRAAAFKALRRLQRAAVVRFAEGQDQERRSRVALRSVSSSDDDDEEDDEELDEDEEEYDEDEDEDGGDEDEDEGDEDEEYEDEDDEEDD